jgi:murein DD-endopeptidase MepM/ murein hydrolase activator NlpD
MDSIAPLSRQIAVGALVLAAMVGLPFRPVAGQTADPEKGASALQHGRHLTAFLLAGGIDSLFPRMARPFQASIGGRAGLAKFMDQVRALGPEIGAPDEAVYGENGTISYYRIGEFKGLPSGTIHWIWDSAGTIQGLVVRPTPSAAPSKFAGRKTRTPLRMPFEGAAYVAWGGRAPHQNYHVQFADQRFAYDFFLLDGGAIHRGDGTRNEDFACFERAIVAPGPGTVRTVLDTVADNRPGRMNPDLPPGNHVVIEHGHGEYSVLAHLRQGSVRVRPGERVKRGQVVGTCGNSGNSSAPHLHYHLQTRARPGSGVGLPAQFRDYQSDARDVPVGEPLRGQRVQATPRGRG